MGELTVEYNKLSAEEFIFYGNQSGETLRL